MTSDPGKPSLDLPTPAPLTAPYLDSSVFLAHIKEEALPCRGTTRFQITQEILGGAEQGKYKVYTSFLTLAEVRRLRESGKELTPDELPEVNSLFARLLENEWLVAVEVGRAVAEKAQALGATFGMSPTDALHLASAILAGCNVLMVWDKGRFSNLFREGPCEGVHVMEPYWEGIPAWPAPPPRPSC
jgi:predicted nucleic acid-binding protein